MSGGCAKFAFNRSHKQGAKNVDFTQLLLAGNQSSNKGFEGTSWKINASG
jgi:uncharacterized protein YjiK